MGYGYWTTTTYCSACDKRVPSDATECKHCGEKLTKEA